MEEDNRLNMEIIGMRALAQRVLAVAVSRLDAPGAWTAYIDAVPGDSHKREAGIVCRDGDKLSEEMARLLFPRFEGPYCH